MLVDTGEKKTICDIYSIYIVLIYTVDQPYVLR